MAAKKKYERKAMTKQVRGGEEKVAKREKYKGKTYKKLRKVK